MTTEDDLLYHYARCGFVDPERLIILPQVVKCYTCGYTEMINVGYDMNNRNLHPFSALRTAPYIFRKMSGRMFVWCSTKMPCYAPAHLGKPYQCGAQIRIPHL